MTENQIPPILEPTPPLPNYTLEQLPEPLLRAAQENGWTSLLPVQSKAIPYLLNANDLIVQSKTGSGKTGAFMLPMLQVIEASVKVPQCLVLVPTRELAKQVFDETQKIGKYTSLSSVAVYGGTGMQQQLTALKAGAQIIIGTPGRVMDHIERGTLKLDNIRDLILDEADEMLGMGFYPDMKKIEKLLPAKRCTYMFSATMAPNVIRLSQEFMNQPKLLNMCPGEFSIPKMDLKYYRVDPMDKDKTLLHLLEMEKPSSAIIFCNTKKNTSYIYEYLLARGQNVGVLSGDIPQNAREKMIFRLKNREVPLLVATDVAARGLDIQDLSHVFNHDIPDDYELFIHRCGRTARAGKEGKAITLVTDLEELALKKIASQYNLIIEKQNFKKELAQNQEANLQNLIFQLYESASESDKKLSQVHIPLIQKLTTEEKGLEALSYLISQWSSGTSPIFKK